MSTIPRPSNNGATYTFASQPRAVPNKSKSKFREPSSHMQKSNKKTIGNMMYDPRIIRGSTYRKQVIPASMQPDPLELKRQQEVARRKQARMKRTQKARPRTPEAVDGRKHIDVQTELYLEELTDRVEEQDVQTQTDPFLDRPPTPLFIPPKTGIDVATQILEGELFDFDMEVKPILEVLVGKTMEQALMEVMEEEELEQLRRHQREFEDLRNAELAEVQRQEEAARRREAEKESRIHEQRQALLEQKETAQKIAARAFAQSYLSELVPTVFTSLSEGGFFYDRQEREVETQFIPWLMDAVDDRLGQTNLAHRLVDEIIRAVVAKRSRGGAVTVEVEEENEVEEVEVEGESSDTPAEEGDPDQGDDGEGDDNTNATGDGEIPTETVDSTDNATADVEGSEEVDTQGASEEAQEREVAADGEPNNEGDNGEDAQQDPQPADAEEAS